MVAQPSERALKTIRSESLLLKVRPGRAGLVPAFTVPFPCDTASRRGDQERSQVMRQSLGSPMSEWVTILTVAVAKPRRNRKAARLPRSA